MKKIHMMIAALLAFLPTMLWANTGSSTTYYAALKTSVSSSGGGKVYADKSNSTPAASSYSASSSTSSNQSSTTKDEAKNFYAFASADEGYEFSHWSTSNGGTSASTANPYTVAVECSSSTESSPTLTTVYAVFKKKTLAAFGITFETSSAGTYTVDGAAPANKTGLTEATSVVLKSTDTNFLNWLVNGTVVSANPYTANCLADTTISAEFLTADQVTSVTTISDLTEALGNAAYKKIIVPSGATLTVAKGSTVTVPAGKQLVVDGTLNVLGTVSNSGVISGSGKLYKISYLIDQGDVITVYTADGKECGAMTCACQDSKMPRYCKTTVTQNSPSVNGTVSCTTSWGVLLNGTTAYAISKQSPKAVKVSLDTAKDSNGKQSVVNKITAITADTDSVNENANYVLFADVTMTGPLDSSKLRSTATVDCAGKKLSAGTNSHSSFGISVLNGSFSASASQWQNAHAAFFNVSSVSLSKVKGTGSTYYFYDCGTKALPCSVSITYYSNTRTSDYKTAYFYNGYFSYSFNTTNDGSGKSMVYGGSYTADPSAYIPTAYDGVLQAQYDGSKYYDVTDYKPPAYVCAVGGKEYESLADAVSAAKNGDVISLSAAIELTGTVTIPSGKSVTLSLENHVVTGGKIVNNGTLLITDSSTGKGTTTTDASGGILKSDIENNGTLDLIFGTYEGSVVNKAGTLTTHNGLFKGSFMKEGGTVNLKGGHFSADVEDLATVENTKVFFENGLYSVCELPDGTMHETVVSSANGYGATPYTDADYDLIAGWFNNKSQRTVYSTEDWGRLAELLCFYQLFNNRGLDATLKFDRDVAADSLNLYAASTVGTSVKQKDALEAGELYRALSAVVNGYGYASKTYKALWQDNLKSVAMAVTDKSGNNAGTVCTAMVELWKEDRAADYSSTGHKLTNTVFIAAEKRFTIGAGANKAMIRPEVGAATFYATVTDALAAAEDGATVMLTQDCEEDVVLAKAGSFTIDQNGFVLTGTVTAGGDYFIETAEDGAYTVAKKGIVDENGNAQASIQDVVNAAVESEAAEVTITIPETTSEQIVALPEDKTLIIVQAEGSETVVNVTPPEGHFVEATVVEPAAGESQGGTTTVYETKKITEAVVTVTEESVQDLSVKLEEFQAGSTETNEVVEVAQIVEAVNNLMENKALERADNVEQAKDETINLKAIVITPKAIVQEVATESEKVVKAAAFDVTPTDTNDNKIENTSFTFRLPVADGMTGSMVVFHEKEFFGVYPILSWSDGAKLHKYIEITSSEFSEYSYEPRRGVEYAVAKIGEVGYDSLEDAVAAAAAGAKVELLMSTTLTNEIAVAKQVTLDLGENTVTAANGKNAIQVAAGGNLTIEATTGGIAAASGFAVYTDYELSQGVKSVTINGGSFSSVQFNKYPLQTSAAQSGESATPTTVAINGGTFNGNVKIYRCPTTIAGGTFEQGLDTSSSSVSVYSNSKTPVRVIGGKFKTEPVSVGNRVFVNAGYYDGGYFVVGDTSVCQAKRNGKFYRSVAEAFAAVGADTRIEILNGADVSDINVTLGEGQALTVPSSFTAVAAANGYTLHTDVNTADGTVTYTAYVDGAVARIGGQHYASLDAAFEAAQDGDTITLVADAALGVTAISADVTLALAEHSVNVTTAGINLTGKLTVTGVGLVSAVPSITGNGELVILGGTWTADPSAFVPQVVTALPGEQDDKAWTKDRCYVFANKAFVDGGWGDAEGFYSVVPLPKAYVTTMSEKPEVGGYGALDCAYTFESFSSANGDDAIAAKFLEGGFSAFSDPVELARAKELLMEKMPFLDWNADFVVSLDGAADAGDLMLSGHYAQWDIGWVSYESPNTIDANQKVRLLVDIGQATPGDWPYENICRYVRTFDCGAKKLKSAMDGKTMTVQLRLYKPGEDEGLGSPSILICEYKYTFGGYAAKIGNTLYTTLADAFAAVQANETIQLLNDYTGAADLSGCEASFTLDKNGFGLAITGEPTTGEDWFFEKMSNDNWFHYYKKPATEEAPVVTVEVVDEDGETMSLSTLTPDADWLDGKVQEGETAEEALAKVEENGLQAWQNYVIGQNPTAAVRVDTEQAPINNTPVANTLTEKVNVPADSGFTVTYELDKIEVDGTVVEGTPQSTAENFNIDLEAATDNESGAAYFKMTAVIEATDGTGAKTKVASENTIGVLKVESSAKSTVIAVPWESLAADGQDITVSDLVRTATLTEGDELKVYDTATGKYRAWTLNGSKEWAPIPVVGGASSEEAGDSTIARGSGVWLTRTDTTQPIYLVGEVAEQSTTTTIAGANEEKPTWNLVAAPTVESVDLNEKFPDANEGDVVLVPTDGAPKRYTYKDGSWGYDDYVTTVNKKGIEVVKVVRNTNVTNVPIGTGFWYMNAGDAKNVEW
ncbi:MAG: hypothetical protein IJ173_08880 [Kiritimatiellae bacterium]|nr:hypothetical protein [Kiritimatiellia bacterium]